MNSAREFELHSLADTARLADAVVQSGAQTIGLTGALGSGKTTFVRQLCAALGGREEDVSSPTFVLCQEYPISSGGVLEHWDLYRLKSAPEELHEPVGAANIRCVEWWEKFPEAVGQNDLILEFVLSEREDSEIRMVRVFGPRAPAVFGSL